MKNAIDKVADLVLLNLVKVLGIALLITVVLQVISRYLPISMVWTDELARLFFVWFSMLSVAVACVENKHLTMDLLYDKFGPKTKKVMDVFANILVMVTAVLLCYEGFKMLPIVQMQISPVLRISMAWFYAAVPVGFVFVAVHTAFRLVDMIFGRDMDNQQEEE